jgi:DNA-binding transcriptional LysR family regulator
MTLRMQADGQSARVVTAGRLICDDMAFVREAVRAGAGIGYLPDFLAEGCSMSGSLQRVLPRWELGNRASVWIVMPSGRRLPRKVAAFRDFLLEGLPKRIIPPPA